MLPRTPGPGAPERSSRMLRPRRLPRPPRCRATASSRGSFGARLTRSDALSAPPGNQPPQTFVQVNLWLPAQLLACPGDVREAPVYRVHPAWGAELERLNGAHRSLQRLRELDQAG